MEPCPFCGDQKREFVANHMECKRCGSRGPAGATPEDAERRWGKRGPFQRIVHKTETMATRESVNDALSRDFKRITDILGSYETTHAKELVKILKEELELWREYWDGER